MKKTLHIWLLITIILILTACNSNTNQSIETSNTGKEKLSVYFLDVGQADAILVNCGEDSMIIDAGNNEDGEEVSSYIKALGIKELEYVIGTHPHEDHIGGLDTVIEDYQVDNVLMPEYAEKTDTYEDVIKAINKKNLNITKPVVGTVYQLGEAVFTIIAPNKADYGDNTNNYSIGIKLTFGKNTFVMVGDAEKEAEKDILSNGIDIQADVLKISHHGGATSTSDEFLHAVDPTYAVISVGKDNSYGHPSSDVVTRLQDDDVQIYRTDKQGTIIATSDGKNITFKCESSDAIPVDSTKEEKTAKDDKQVKGDNQTEDNNQAEDKNQAEDNKQVVYITETGSKYHRADCSFLKNSKISINLEDAKEEGYEPCSKCNPPR